MLDFFFLFFVLEKTEYMLKHRKTHLFPSLFAQFVFGSAWFVGRYLAAAPLLSLKISPQSHFLLFSREAKQTQDISAAQIPQLLTANNEGEKK